jgi:hypothetical protein
MRGCQDEAIRMNQDAASFSFAIWEKNAHGSGVRGANDIAHLSLTRFQCLESQLRTGAIKSSKREDCQ